ncbi:MAG TPA: signal peptidase I [Solirubrobacteraceae bacterium]|nr:signal peptidase I [Solirubrobacteraceae bacterium]
MSRAARDWLGVVVVWAGLGIAVWQRHEDTERYRIPSESMIPTLEIGDRITVNKEAYDDEDPELQDIVVIRPPRGAVSGGRLCGVDVSEGELCPRPRGKPADVFFVQRIVAGPGDRLRVRRGRAIVDGKPLEEPYAQRCVVGVGCTPKGEITIPDDHWFMMGDNRGASDDSRFWGPVPRDQIVGRADDCRLLNLRCEKSDDPG